MSRRTTQTGPEMHVQAPRKKRKWPWIVGGIVVIGLIGSLLSDNDDQTQGTSAPSAPQVAALQHTSASPVTDPATEPILTTAPTTVPTTTTMPTTAPTTTTVAPTTVEAVPREYRNALQSANDYLAYTAFSKGGLYDQLLYEQYPPEAAQYAVNNVEADWNEQALRSANDYLGFTAMSNGDLYDQLIYEKFTPEQAQYAIDNLD